MLSGVYPFGWAKPLGLNLLCLVLTLQERIPDRPGGPRSVGGTRKAGKDHLDSREAPGRHQGPPGRQERTIWTV